MKEVMNLEDMIRGAQIIYQNKQEFAAYLNALNKWIEEQLQQLKKEEVALLLKTTPGGGKDTIISILFGLKYALAENDTTKKEAYLKRAHSLLFDTRKSYGMYLYPDAFPRRMFLDIDEYIPALLANKETI